LPAKTTSPAVVDGTVYTGCTDKHVYALDATCGTEKWRFRLDESMRSSPAVMDGIIYVVDRNQVYALDANTGTIQWASNLDRNHYEPVVADSTVYIAGDRLVQALDANTGTQQWVFEPPGLGHGVTPPTVRDGTIYIGSGNDSGTDTVYALGVGDDRVDAQAGQLNRDENAGTGTDVSREETEQPETKP
jgi:outer membrane protein assembly factor BamB